jgi:NADPH-dependent F420 reductase
VKTDAMKTKQTIAIIGADDNMGSAIAKSIAGGNYRLLLFANEADKLKSTIDEVKQLNSSADIETIDCQYDACWEADIIIPAVPYKAEKEVAERIKEVATQKIVISMANPFNQTFDDLVTSADTSAAEELQKLLPNSKVVKAFNTTFAADFTQPVISGEQVDVFIAGDDEEALEIVVELVETVGFNPIVAGDLSVSRTLERMQLLLIQLNMKYNFNRQAGWKILHN